MIHPFKEKKNIAVAFSTDEYYMPYLATAIESIVLNAKEENNYDIIILGKDLSELSRSELINRYSKHSNISIRFFDPSEYIATSGLTTWENYPEAIYFRLALFNMLEMYNKVLYLDVDIIVLEDISELFEIDLKDNLLGATLDSGVISRYLEEEEIKNYIDDFVVLKNPKNYFNSGVICFNLKEFRNCIKISDVLSTIKEKKWKYPDQDVLNKLCEGKVEIFEKKWNVQVNVLQECKSQSYEMKFKEALQNPAILHFAGDKPWNGYRIIKEEYFWKYAANSAFVERIYLQMLIYNNKKLSNEIQDKYDDKIIELQRENVELRKELDNISVVKLFRESYRRNMKTFINNIKKK